MCITYLSRDSCRNLICKNLGRDFKVQQFEIGTKWHAAARSQTESSTEYVGRHGIRLGWGQLKADSR